MIESERKFLVVTEYLPTTLDKCPAKLITSAYFTKDSPAVRVTYGSDKCKVCLKFGSGQHRHEFEYTIPSKDCEKMIELADTKLTKTRYYVGGWEVDRIFLYPENPSKDLWVCEWEEKEGKAKCPEQKPVWVGKEITDDLSYSMQALAWKYGKK